MLRLVLRRVAVVAVAVGALDRAVLAVKLELGFLVAADSAAELRGLRLGGSDPAGPLAAVALDLPAVLGRHYPGCRVPMSLPFIARK